MQCPNYKVVFVIVAVIKRHNVKLTAVPAWRNRHSGKSVRSNLKQRPRSKSEASRMQNQLILRAIGCQLLADGQRLGLESSERVGAAIRSRIHCENHALATVAGSSVCSLATMDPDGLLLIGNRLERKVSSIM